ncbi:MAG: hypothetical protein WAN03_10725 [Candidatus Sulfotelmatobacter sp.]
MTPWTHLFKQEAAPAGKLADIDELERMWSLSPEPFFCNFELQRQDEARERAEKDIHELNRIWRLLDRRTPQSFPCGQLDTGRLGRIRQIP